MARKPRYVKTNHRAITAFYNRQPEDEDVVDAQDFRLMLNATAKRRGWTLSTQSTLSTNGDRSYDLSGVFHSAYSLPRGYWATHSPTSSEHLDAAIQKHIEAKVPTDNIIFEDQREAVLYQNGEEILRAQVQNKKAFVTLLNSFYTFTTPAFKAFETAVEKYEAVLPEMAKTAVEQIKIARKQHYGFSTAFETLYHQCRDALYAKLNRDVVAEMLIQHLLVERLIRNMLDRPEFNRQNAMAQELQKVFTALPTEYFDRHQFARGLEPFFSAVEDVATEIQDFSQKQQFLIAIWKHFLHGYAVPPGDAHTLNQTPTPLVDFMCRMVEDVLKRELNIEWDYPSVSILDPATGNGEYIINLLQRLPKDRLTDIYQRRLFANEMMLLPYYLASINIERAYESLAGEPVTFKGLAFADTLDLKKRPQMTLDLFREENEDRINRQQNAKLTVIIGDPLTYAGKLDESSRRRRYRSLKRDPLPGIDDRIDVTYAKDSTASKHTRLYDTYVRFIRWCTDRLGGRRGVICLLTRNDYMTDPQFDGLRKHLLKDFDILYCLNLHGEPDDQATGNQIVVESILPLGGNPDVSVTILAITGNTPKQLFYTTLDFSLTAEEKLAQLQATDHIDDLRWKSIRPTDDNEWLLVEPPLPAYSEFMPIGSVAARRSEAREVTVIFRKYTSGVNSKRDVIVYANQPEKLTTQVQKFIKDYNAEVSRHETVGGEEGVRDLDDFLRRSKIPWTENLKKALLDGKQVNFNQDKIRSALFRPYTTRFFYADSVINEDLDIWPEILPTPAEEVDNRVICVGGNENAPLSVLMSNQIADANLVGAGTIHSFPFYVYDANGEHRSENITDWALSRFHSFYNNRTLTKWDVFYYVYAVLHHPHYRAHYATAMTQGFPRIPFLSDFRGISRIGRRLADLHVNPMQTKPYALTEKVAAGKTVHYRVKRLRLNKAKTIVTVNPTLKLEGIPPKAHQYMIGNRSALQWFVDTYQGSPVIASANSETRSDNRNGNSTDPTTIVDWLGKMVTVSLETVRLTVELTKIAPIDIKGESED